MAEWPRELPVFVERDPKEELREWNAPFLKALSEQIEKEVKRILKR